MFRALILLAALATLGPGRSLADETITSDTLDYCNALADRLEQRAPPASVRLLLVEGRAMCQRGHVMGGLRRLRLAMMIVHHQPPSLP